MVIRAALLPNSTGQVWAVVNLDKMPSKKRFLLIGTIEYCLATSGDV